MISHNVSSFYPPEPGGWLIGAELPAPSPTPTSDAGSEIPSKKFEKSARGTKFFYPIDSTQKNYPYAANPAPWPATY